MSLPFDYSGDALRTAGLNRVHAQQVADGESNRCEDPGELHDARRTRREPERTTAQENGVPGGTVIVRKFNVENRIRHRRSGNATYAGRCRCPWKLHVTVLAGSVGTRCIGIQAEGNDAVTGTGTCHTGIREPYPPRQYLDIVYVPLEICKFTKKMAPLLSDGSVAVQHLGSHWNSRNIVRVFQDWQLVSIIAGDCVKKSIYPQMAHQRS